MKKVAVFFIGIITALVLLEGGLRLVGFMYKSNTRIHVSALLQHKAKAYVILCLGNSYTEGLGAPLEMSYPAQLQRLCDKRVKDKNIVVINKGSGGQNTAQLLGDLKFNINTYNPQLIILQTGQPNNWNFLKYSDYLKKKNKNISFLACVQYFLTDLLYASRVYKLFILVHDELWHVNPLVNPAYRCEKSYLEAVSLVKGISKYNRNVIDDQYEKSLGIFKRAVKCDPNQSRNYLFMGTLYRSRNNCRMALEFYLKAFRVALAQRDPRRVSKAYRMIQDVTKGRGPWHALINKKLYKLLEDSQQALYFIAGLNRSEISDWVASDLREAVAIIRQNNVRLILQNYPKWVYENSILSRIADEYNLPFVDNYSSFQEEMKNGVTEQDLFVPDTHCNARGYGLMAENVFHKIMEEGFLKVVDRH